MDICKDAPGPAGVLSIMSDRYFMFGDLSCASVQSLLESLKFEDPKVQRAVCRLSAAEAAKKGKERDAIWQRDFTLWRQGQKIFRHSETYQILLGKIFYTLAGTPHYQLAIRATGEETLTCSELGDDPALTVLTGEELCSILMNIRFVLIE